jgi:hypothetical protein
VKRVTEDDWLVYDPDPELGEKEIPDELFERLVLAKDLYQEVQCEIDAYLRNNKK